MKTSLLNVGSDGTRRGYPRSYSASEKRECPLSMPPPPSIDGGISAAILTTLRGFTCR